MMKSGTNFLNTLYIQNFDIDYLHMQAYDDYVLMNWWMCNCQINKGHISVKSEKKTKMY